jgi:hypothetical protein
MQQWRAMLPTVTPHRHEMLIQARTIKAAKVADVEFSESQAIWNDAKVARRLAIKIAEYRQDPDFLRARRKTATYVDWLYDPVDGVVTQRLIRLHKDTKAVRSVLRAQRQYVIDLDMTPAAIGEFCERGRDRKANSDLDQLPASATKEDRKAREYLLKHRARQRTQEFKELVHRGLIAEEIEIRLFAGVPIVKAEVVNALVKAGTVGRSTAYAYFDDVLLTVQRTVRYQDGTISSFPLHVGHPIEVIPVTIQDPESSDLPVPVTTSDTVKTTDSGRDPAKITDLPLPPWVVDKNSLIDFEDACLRRDAWRVAVAAWRSAKARQRTIDEAADLADDPGFRAMVLERSAWSHHRLH